MRAMTVASESEAPSATEPRRGIRPVRNRRPGPPAVGCRPDASAEPYRIGPGEESGDEAAAEFRFGLAAYQGRELVFDSQRPAFPGRSFRSVASAVAELQPDLFTFRTGKIVEQGSGNLFPCQVFLPFDMLFERRKGIGDDCQPRRRRSKGCSIPLRRPIHPPLFPSGRGSAG